MTELTNIERDNIDFQTRRADRVCLFVLVKKKLLGAQRPNGLPLLSLPLGLCKQHKWFKENYSRDVCIECGLVNHNPKRSTSVKNDMSISKKFINPLNNYRKVKRDLTAFENSLAYGQNNHLKVKKHWGQYYNNFCSFTGKKT